MCGSMFEVFGDMLFFVEMIEVLYGMVYYYIYVFEFVEK